MAVLKTYRGIEPIYFGTAHEVADLLCSRTIKAEYSKYSVWTDQQGKFALCRVWPCPSWKEITRHELYLRQCTEPGV